MAKRPLNGFPYHVERIDTCGQMAEHGELRSLLTSYLCQRLQGCMMIFRRIPSYTFGAAGRVWLPEQQLIHNGPHVIRQTREIHNDDLGTHLFLFIFLTLLLLTNEKAFN